jgi:hypothetical protein
VVGNGVGGAENRSPVLDYRLLLGFLEYRPRGHVP